MVTRTLAPLLAVLLAAAGCGGGDDAEAKQAALTPAPSAATQEGDVEEPAAPAATAASNAVAPPAAPDSAAPASVPASAVAPEPRAAEDPAAPEDSAAAAPEEGITGRETFSYSGGSRDPFASLLNARLGPELSDLMLVAIYYDVRSPNSSVIVMREKVGGRKYSLRPGDRLGRTRLTSVGPKDATFTIDDFGTERQETVSLRKQEDAQ